MLRKDLPPAAAFSLSVKMWPEVLVCFYSGGMKPAQGFATEHLGPRSKALHERCR